MRLLTEEQDGIQLPIDNTGMQYGDQHGCDRVLALLQALYNIPGLDSGTGICVLDTRSFESYQSRRLQDSANLPLLHLTEACFLLPDKPRPLAVVASSSEYTVTTDKVAHGTLISTGSVAVYLNGAADLGDFLQSRGWNLQAVLPDTPELWHAAQQLGVVEGPVPQPQALKRRWLFSPAPILRDEISLIESLVCQHRGFSCAPATYEQDHQQSAAQKEIVAPTIVTGKTCSSASNGGVKVTLEQGVHCEGIEALKSSVRPRLRALDLGCGSGRDLIWLACRHMDQVEPGPPNNSCSSESKQSKPHAPEQHQQSEELNDDDHHHRQQQQQEVALGQQQAGPAEEHQHPATMQQQQREEVTVQEPSHELPLVPQPQQQGEKCLRALKQPPPPPPLPQPPQHQQKEEEGDVRSELQLQQQQQQVIWSVTGVDEWHGALVRAQHLAQLACLPQHQVQLLLAKVDPESGELQQLPLPKGSPLQGWGCREGVASPGCSPAALPGAAGATVPSAGAVGKRGSIILGAELLMSQSGGDDGNSQGCAVSDSQGKAQQQQQQQRGVLQVEQDLSIHESKVTEQQQQQDSIRAEVQEGQCPVAAGATVGTGGIQASCFGPDGRSVCKALLEPGSFDLVLCVRFLERAALPCIAKLLRSGGCVAYCTFVEGPGLAAFGRPTGRERVLEPHELRRDWFGTRQGFRVIKDKIALSGDGRELSYFIAQKL
jgi:hypothetical protein